MLPQLDLSAQIVPAVGLGGFAVGRPLTDYEDLLRRGHSFDRVTPRVHGHWQVVYRISQIYEQTEDEKERSDAALARWQEARRTGAEATLEEAVNTIRPPADPPAIDLWVDIRDGVVDAVTALDGYRGRFRSLRTGMTYGDARASEPEIVDRFFLDETVIKDVEGLGLWFEPADPNPEHRDSALLTGITVFDPTRSDQGIKPY